MNREVRVGGSDCRLGLPTGEKMHVLVACLGRVSVEARAHRSVLQFWAVLLLSCDRRLLLSLSCGRRRPWPSSPLVLCPSSPLVLDVVLGPRPPSSSFSSCECGRIAASQVSAGGVLVSCCSDSCCSSREGDRFLV